MIWRAPRGKSTLGGSRSGSKSLKRHLCQVERAIHVNGPTRATLTGSRSSGSRGRLPHLRTMHLPMLQTTRYRVLPSATTGDVHRSSPGQRLDVTSSATKSPSASAGAGGQAKRTRILGCPPLGTAQRRPMRGQTFISPCTTLIGLSPQRHRSL